MEYGVRSSNNNNKWSSLSSTLLEGEKEMEGYDDGGGGCRDLVCMGMVTTRPRHASLWRGKCPSTRRSRVIIDWGSRWNSRL